MKMEKLKNQKILILELFHLHSIKISRIKKFCVALYLAIRRVQVSTKKITKTVKEYKRSIKLYQLCIFELNKKKNNYTLRLCRQKALFVHLKARIKRILLILLVIRRKRLFSLYLTILELYRWFYQRIKVGRFIDRKLSSKL